MIEFLFGESCHDEIIWWSEKILKFLNDNNALDFEILNLLWKSQEGKHEETVWAVFDTISQITIYLNLENLNFLFKKISLIPQKDYNDVTIKFIKDFTDSALFRVRNLKEKESSEPWFSLENELEET